MNKKYEGCEKGFTQWTKSWYSQQEIEKKWIEQIILGFYDIEDGSTFGEMAVRWYPMDGELPAASLEVFEDSWEALACLPDLIAEMAKLDSKSPRPEDFIQVLLMCGFRDRTKPTP